MVEIELQEFSIFVFDFDLNKSKFQWGCSSVGRAVALQAIGQEFESPQLHQPSLAAKRSAKAAAPKRLRRRASTRSAGYGSAGQQVLLGV